MVAKQNKTRKKEKEREGENPKWHTLKSVPIREQTKREESFVVKCTWKRTDANENNFSLNKQKEEFWHSFTVVHTKGLR